MTLCFTGNCSSCDKADWIDCEILTQLTHSLTAALDQLRVVASITVNE